MSRKLVWIGAVGTVLYLGLGTVFAWGRLDELKHLPLNELGDFLAGAFGPLTIFWLVLGFFQQGEELRMNTDALHLQAKELQQSADQQRALVRLATNEHAERQLRAQPTFVVSGVDAAFAIGSSKTRLGVRILNIGATATDVHLTIAPDSADLKPKHFPAMVAGGSAGIEGLLSSEKLPYASLMTIKFKDSLGNRGEVQFAMRLERDTVDPTTCILICTRVDPGLG